MVYLLVHSPAAPNVCLSDKFLLTVVARVECLGVSLSLTKAGKGVAHETGSQGNLGCTPHPPADGVVAQCTFALLARNPGR